MWNLKTKNREQKFRYEIGGQGSKTWYHGIKSFGRKKEKVYMKSSGKESWGHFKLEPPAGRLPHWWP